MNPLSGGYYSARYFFSAACANSGSGGMEKVIGGSARSEGVFHVVSGSSVDVRDGLLPVRPDGGKWASPRALSTSATARKFGSVSRSTGFNAAIWSL